MPMMDSPQGCKQELLNADGTVALHALLSKLCVTERDLAGMLGFPGNALSGTMGSPSPAAEHRLRDLVEILAHVSGWFGSITQAFAWYRAKPLPSFGDQTAADLVREGRADSVKSHLARLADGGYA